MNDTPLHTLKTSTLVRFRCMVQDTFDPEYYLGSYEVRKKESNECKMCCGMYKDIAQCQVSVWFERCNFINCYTIDGLTLISYRYKQFKYYVHAYKYSDFYLN